MGGEKAANLRAVCGPKWITPAWAGKSEQQLRAAYEMGDHPRMGGEKVVAYSSKPM